MPVCTRNVLRWSSRAPSPRPAPITPDVLDPCGDAWRRPSPSVALSAELSNDSGFSSSIVRPEQSRYQITDVASVSRSGLCINESPSGTAVVAPWVICGFL